MNKALASILTALAVAGCESNAGPNFSTMLGYQVDAERNRSVWLTRDGVQIHGGAGPVRVELPGWIYAGTPHCPPGLAVGPKGEIVVTSNVIPTLWRIDDKTFAVTVHPLALDADQDKDVGFAAVAYAAEQGAFIAYSGTQRSVWKIDSSLKSAAKLAAVDPERPRAARGRPVGCANYAKRLARPD